MVAKRRYLTLYGDERDRRQTNFGLHGHLYKYLREEDRADCISFVDPGSIPTCPIGKDGRDLSRHIAEQLEAVCRDSICLIPYNTGNRDDAWKTTVTNGVKMYNASKCISQRSCFKQLTGNLKQSGSVECEYCVMRYMKEIVESENPQLEKLFAGSIKNQYYNQFQYDEVRSEWSEYVYSYVGA